MALGIEDFLFRTSWLPSSGVPADANVNDWAIKWVGSSPSIPGDTEYTAAATAFGDFYKNVYNLGSSILKSSASANQIGWQMYGLSDPEPRVPVASGNITGLSTAGVGAVPQELAICTSFQGARVSGDNQARKRGRVYLGFLSINAIGTNGLVASAAVTRIANETETLQSALSTAGWQLSVWSRVGAFLYGVTDGWVDNAFDIQRRRGVEASSRVSWTA